MIPFTNVPSMQSGFCFYYYFLSGRDYSDQIWYYNVVVYVIFNCILLATASSFAIILVVKIYKASHQVEQTGKIVGGRKKRSTYTWLMVLLMSNLMCLIPFEVLLILSLSGYQLDLVIVHWFTILVLPLNSLTNPFLYTIRTILKR